ncbi:MAG: hypothetical protein ACRECY_15045, partial [Phyllobacterium sp.]
MMKLHIASSALAVVVLAGCSTTSGGKDNDGMLSRWTGSSAQPAKTSVLAALGNGLIGSNA